MSARKLVHRGIEICWRRYCDPTEIDRLRLSCSLGILPIQIAYHINSVHEHPNSFFSRKQLQSKFQLLPGQTLESSQHPRDITSRSSTTFSKTKADGSGGCRDHDWNAQSSSFCGQPSGSVAHDDYVWIEGSQLSRERGK